MSTQELITAIEIMGSQTALAEALQQCGHVSIKQQNISNWIKSKRPKLMPPAEVCRSIEKVTAECGQIVSRYVLRPDVFGAEPKLSSSGVASA